MKQLKDIKIGERFRFYRGRKHYTFSEIRRGFLLVFHDDAGIELSVDIELFPSYLRKSVHVAPLKQLES